MRHTLHEIEAVVIQDAVINYLYRVVRAPLMPGSPGMRTSYWDVGRVSAPPAAIFVSPQSTYLVALAGSKAYTYRLPTSTSQTSDPDQWNPTLIKFVSDQSFTCGAFAPEKNLGGQTSEEEWFATGDIRGIIRLWHGVGAAFNQLDAVAACTRGASEPGRSPYPDMERRLPTTSLHWHAHAVAAIRFTPSGAQLLSVGEESVLVQWHLASGKREYIPRLGGTAILSLAVREGSRGVEEEWWMGFADGGAIRVGAATGNVSTVGQDIRLGTTIRTLAALRLMKRRPTPKYIRQYAVSFQRAPCYRIPRCSLLSSVNTPVHRSPCRDRPLRSRSRPFQSHQPARRERARARCDRSCGILGRAGW